MEPGIIVGLAAEARIARRLGWPVAIGDDAGQAACRLIDAGARALISFGLAGGLDPALRSGTLIVPAAIVTDDEYHATDVDLSRRLGGQTPLRLFGSRTVIAEATQKRDLRERTGAAAVDMESGAVARVAARHRLPFAALRAVCDPAERSLPPAALQALDASGAIRALQILRSIGQQPSQVSALLRLAADAAAARRALLTRIRQIALAECRQANAGTLPR